MGPGCAVKAALGHSFSLTVFGFAQVAMDLEPLARMARGDDIIHGFSHTYLGATLIGVASVLVGRPVCQRLLNYWTPGATGFGSGFLDWLRGPRTITWRAAITGAFIGTYSHVFLDSIMHPDMQPFWPFAPGNSLLGLVSLDWLHLFCVAAGAVGLAGLFGTYLVFGRGRSKTGP
jgi:hypothetical protein